jgi:peroxiredoxin
LLSALVASACASTPTTASKPKPASSANGPGKPLEKIDLFSLRFVGMDDGPVPDFQLRTTEKQIVDSQSLIGARPFAIVFFATWCDQCDKKLAALHEALASFNDFTVIGVAVDDKSTWKKVPNYIKKHGFHIPIVAALEHPSFSVSYNPWSTVPLVVIVGRNGGLVDYQLGCEPNDNQRLVSSLELAKTIGPLKHQTSSG